MTWWDRRQEKSRSSSLLSQAALAVSQWADLLPLGISLKGPTTSTLAVVGTKFSAHRLLGDTLRACSPPQCGW